MSLVSTLKSVLGLCQKDDLTKEMCERLNTPGRI
jgi:hypothetical protein